MRKADRFVRQMVALASAAALMLCQVPAVAAVSATAGEAPTSAGNTELTSGTAAEATVVSECVDLREESVKHFLLSDGTVRAVQYDVPVHYWENGTWVDYDNRLTSSNTRLGTRQWTTACSDAGVTFPETLGSDDITLEKDGYAIGWRYVGSQNSTGTVSCATASEDPTVLTRLSSTVRYTDAFFDADLEYTVSSAGVKENMVLKSAEAPHSFTAHYTVEGLSAVAVDSRTVELRNEAGAVIYTLTAPCMTDAAGAVSTALTYTVTENGTGGFTVCLTADSAWLHSTERVFPVTVDPEISLTGTAAVESTYVDEATPTANHSGDAMMLVGDVAVPVGDGDEWERPVSRALLRIKTLPALSDCDTVVSATLAAYVMVSSGEQYLTAHAVTDNWDVDTVTWNSRIAFGTAVDAQDTSHVPVDETYEGHRYQWDITRLARDWYAGSNTGVMLCSSTEGGTYAAQATVCTARYTGREAVAPVFTVDYRSGTGLEDYWSYVGAEAGRDGTAAVNVFNGNAVVTQPVTLSAGGNRLPVSFTLVYNSNRAGHTMAYSPVGNGWQTNFHVTMTPYDSDGDGSTDGYRLTDSDGTQHAFPVTSAEAYADEDGLGYTLTVQNSGCTVTDRSNNRLAFDEQGFLVSITDASDNEATLQYTALANGNRRLSTVTDGAGRVYTWQYGSGENVQSVRDPSGRVTAFTYADGALTGITYPDGKCVTMAYADGRLSSIAGNDGGTTELTYNADDMYRTACLLRRFGTAVDFQAELAYGLNETVVTDERGQSVRYQLDNYGQTTGVISCEDGSGVFSRYENRNENMLKANKVSQQSVLQQAVINLLPNSGFDSGADGFYTLKNGNSTATFAWDGTRGRTANGSLKVTRSGTPSASGDYAFYACYFDAPKTGWYTLSGYANTAGATIESHGAELRLERWSNGHGTALGGNGYAVNHTEEDEWAYGTVSLFFNAGETVKCLVGMEDAVGVGTAWFDDLQLEYGEVANPYTMLVNGDFTRGTAGWKKQGNGTVTAITDADAPTGKAMQVTGNIREFNWTTQTVQVNGKAGDRYSAGGWGKADSIATEEPSRDIDVNTSFGIQVEFVNGTSFVNTVYIPFNRYVRSWQMATGEAVAQGDYTAVRVRLMYSYNLNTAQFAQLYLHRCSYGQTYEYDEKAQLIRTQGTDNTAMSYTYDDNYNLIQQLTPSGSSYRYDYDEKGRLVSADNTAGSRSAVTYDAFGNVLSSVLTKTALQNGEQYVLRHAATEKVISTASQIAAMAVSGTGSNSPWRLEQHGSNTFRLYSVAGDESGEACTLNKTAADEIAEGDYHLLGVRETNASLFRFVRQDDGRFVLLTAASNYTRCLTVAETGHLTDTLYDEDAVTDAEKWTVENALPSQVQYIQTLASYTSSGNFAATGTDALGNTTSYVYNETTGLLQSVTDASGVTATYTYDSNSGFPQSVTVNGQTVSYTYDTADRLTALTAPNGQRYTLRYDERGRIVAICLGSGETAVELCRYAYSEETGLLASQRYANGTVYTYTYDTQDRQIAVACNGSECQRYWYNAAGNTAAVADLTQGELTRYLYDASGRQLGERVFTTATTGTAETITAALLSATQVRRESTVAYRTDTGKLAEETVTSLWGSTHTAYIYGDAEQGQNSEAVYAVESTDSNRSDRTERVAYTYDALGRVTARTVRIKESAGTALSTAYTYAAGGHGSGSTSTQLMGMNTGYTDFTCTYDSVGRITAVYRNGVLYEAYDYDAWSQLVRVTESDGTVYTYTYTAGGNLSTVSKNGTVVSTYTYGNSAWADQLTAVNGESITYDAAGNPLSYLHGLTMDWENGRYPVRVGNTTFTYAADGTRLSKTVGGITTDYVYVGGRLYGEITGNNRLVYLYDNTAAPYGYLYNDEVYFYERNLQGDVVGLVNENGVRIANYTYTA